MFKYLNINISKYRKKAEKKIALLIDIKNKNIKKWQKFSKKQKIQYAGAGFLILIALLSLSFYFFYNRSAEADWFDDGWHYRRKLTFNNASSTENLANFPVLVSLNSSRIDYSNTQDSGQDIRFTDPNGIILKYEIEEWNESGTSTVWVKIPQIDAGSTIDYIYMYYGNPDASDGQDMENVWDSDFKMVQHLQEASTSTDAYVDSTSNNYDGTATSSFAAANLDATGKIDGANDFDGTDDWIDIGASYDGVKTVEFWIEADNTTKDIIDLNGSAYISVSSGNATTTGFTSPTIYVNGVATTTIDTTWRYAAVTTGTGLNASDLDIGRREGGTYFDGIIDEVRISSAARSGEWIEAQYKSMTDTYITYGSEENQEGAIVVWHFNEGSGSVAYDDSNYDNDLSISGASWITGKFGNALSFDGDDVASTSDAASLDMGTQDWSISTWLKTSASATSTIIEKSGSSVAWLGTWSKRIEITASNTNVDNDLTQFPVLLKLGTSVGTNSADVSAVFDELQSDDNRTKIAVTKSDGTTELYVEIEKWDDANEQAVLWVSRSGWVLDADAPTTLYLYYDSSQADNTIYVGDVNSTPGAAVWDANYKGVYHLGEAVNTDAGGYKDSTSNNNDGTGVSMALNAPSAKIGIGQEFDGTADYITLPFTLATPYALEVWGKPDSLALGAVLLSQALTDTTGGGVAMGYYNTSNEILVGNNTLRRGLSGISTYLTAGTWQYWVDVVAANNNIIFYLDGVDKGTGTAVNYWSNDSGKATIAARCVGAAYSRFFDGSIDEVRISNTARSATWIKANYYTQTDGLVSWGSEEQKQGYKLEALASGVVRATIASATTTLTVDSSNTVNDNAWHHIETTFDRDGNMVMYVDGQNKGSTDISSISSADISTSANLYVGVDYTGSANYFTGSLDEIYIYNYTQTAAQVLRNYNAELSAALPIQFGADTTGTTTGPVADWRLDTGAGTTAYDDTTNNNDLAISGASWISSGKFGNALSFDGVNDVATSSNSTSINIQGNLSISAWVKATDFATTTQQWIVHKDSGSAGYAFGFGTSANTMALKIDGTDYESDTTFSLTNDTWHHFGVSLSGTSTTFYLDGKQLGGVVNGANAPPADSSAQILRLGSDGSNYFSGVLDEVRIYNYARSAAEVRVDYNKGMAVMLGGGTKPASNWLTGWSYRKSITLSRASGAVTNYQMKLLVGESSGAAGEDVDCAAHVQTDFDDLRFTTSDGTTLLDYWIESISGTTPNQLATIWIEFDSIGTEPTTFYMYYGNAGASAVSSGANTFIRFENFEWGINGDSIGDSGGNITWVETSAEVNVSTEQAYGGTRSAKFVGDDGGATDARADSDFGMSPDANTAVRFRVYKEAAASNYRISMSLDAMAMVGSIDVDENFRYLNAGGSAYVDTGANINADAWNLIEWTDINETNKTADLWLNGVKVGEDLAVYASAYAGDGQFRSWLYVSGLTTDAFFDDIVIRSWRATEPAWGSWGGEEVADKPIAFWRMDEGQGGTIYDDSANNNDGNVSASSTMNNWTAGKYGNAIDFDSTNDYITASDSTSLSITSDLSISAWIRPDVVSKEQTILGKWDETTGTDDRSYRLWLDSSNNLNFSVSTDGSAVVTHIGTATTFSAGAWYHIEGVYDDAGTMDVYVDGKLDATQKSSSVPASIDDNVSNLYIGGKENTGGSVDTKFDGAIDDVRVYDYARTASQVLIDYNGGFAVWLGE